MIIAEKNKGIYGSTWTATRAQFARIKRLQRLHTFKRRNEYCNLIDGLEVKSWNSNAPKHFPNL